LSSCVLFTLINPGNDFILISRKHMSPAIEKMSTSQFGK